MVQNVRKVSIKGIREGLLISVEDGPYDDVFADLKTELAEKRDFLQGSKMVLQVGKRALHRSQLSEIKDLFEQQDLTLWTVLTERESTRSAARELGLATRLPGSPTDLDGNVLPSAASPVAEPEREMDSAGPKSEPAGLLLRETLRSGRSVYSEGHVVIIGDVNPGAEIIAGGDVIVWGRLRGLVHAGALGDETAVICALDLNPTQLRIADQIAVPPEDNSRRPAPERALIRSGQIVAVPWQSRS